MRTNVVGTLYLLHFSVGVCGRAYHYLGWAHNGSEGNRFEEHKSGRGARICAAAIQQGATLLMVRTWEGKTRNDERKLKRQRNHARLCPLCKQEYYKRDTERRKQKGKA